MSLPIEREFPLEFTDEHRLRNFAHDIAISAREIADRALREMRQDGLALQHYPELQDAGYIVWTAVHQNGLALQYASENERDHHYDVGTAVQQNGLALQYASARLRDDTDTVALAVLQNLEAIRFASDRLRKDLDWLSGLGFECRGG